MTIKTRLEDICTFLKPAKPEYTIYAGSGVISYIVGAPTYFVTKDPYYTALAAVSPQILEYISFRAYELISHRKGVHTVLDEYKQIDRMRE